MQTGDKGKILGKPGGEGNGWIRVTRIRDGVNGFVPVICINPGNRNKYGEIEFLDKLLVASHAPLLGKPLVGPQPFRNHVKAFLEAVYANRHTFHLIPDWFVETVEQENFIDDVSGRIIKGVSQAGLLHILNRDDFTMQELRDAGTAVKRSTHLSGIYAIFYEQFRVKVPFDGATYVGKSGDFGKRDVEHVTATKDKTQQGVHYSIARLADKRTMFPLCLLSGKDEYFHVAEQVFIALLETYCEEVLGSFLLDSKATGDIKIEWDKWKDDRVAARFFAGITNQLKGYTNWPGGLARAGFGSSKGLNWQSPMSVGTFGATTAFSKTTTPDGVMHFRKVGAVVSKGRTPLMHIKGKHQFNPYRPGEWTDPKEGDLCHVVAEIVPQGQVHPAPYGRHPGLGPFSDWQDSFRLGFRIEWQIGDGSWRRRYLQSAAMWNFADKDVPGSWSSYAVSMGLIRYFLQQHVHNPPHWYRDYGVARIKEANFDWLSQTVQTSDLEPSLDPVPKPATLTLGQMGDRIRALGATNVGGAFGVFPAFTRRLVIHASKSYESNLQGLPGDNRQRSNFCDGCWVWKWPVSTQPLERNRRVVTLCRQDRDTTETIHHASRSGTPTNAETVETAADHAAGPSSRSSRLMHHSSTR